MRHTQTHPATRSTTRPTTAALLTCLTVCAAGTARAADSPTDEILLDGRIRNPSIKPGLSGQSWTFVRDAFVQEVKCGGYITRTPIMVFKPQGIRDLVIQTPGAGLMVVQLDDNRVLADCGSASPVPEIKLQDLHLVGKITLWAGTMSQGERFGYSVRLEDPKRPLEMNFPPKTPRVRIAEDPKKTIVQAVNVPKGQGARSYGALCGDSLFRAAPDLLLEVARPLPDIEIEVRSPKSVRLMIAGPYPKDNRVVERCIKERSFTAPKLEAGLYAIRVGTPAGTPTVATLVVHGKKTLRDPLLPAPIVPDPLPLGDRNVFFHFPQLLGSEVRELDEIRQGLFDVAPPQLFVFPKSDLVELRTVFDPRLVSGAPQPELPDSAVIEYPKKDEPLLLVGANQALSADGNMYEVQTVDLVEEPTGRVRLPESARNGRITFGAAPMSGTTSGGGGGGSGSGEQGSASREYRACADKVWSPVDKKITQLRAQPFSVKREEQIRAAQQQARDQEEKQCLGDAQKRKAVRDEFIKGRIAKRNAALAKLRRRFATLYNDDVGNK